MNRQFTPHWRWQTWQNRAYLTCSLLSPWQHGFFTREFDPHTPETLTSILQSEIVYRVRQVHGNSVLTPQEIDQVANNSAPNSLVAADGIISDRSKQSVWVASADCTPVLIGDTVTGRACAIHAGWRGTAKTIVPEAVERFFQFGSKPENLRIAIGPAISGKLYQVDKNVAVEVCRTIVLIEHNKTPAEILAELQQLATTPIFDDELPHKVRLDIPSVNQIQLEQLGILPEQIAIAPYCTFQQEERFFSYRRTGEKKVQWSGIVSF